MARGKTVARSEVAAIGRDLGIRVCRAWAASRPKFLLTLTGAGHLGPYTSGQPQLGVVERVTTAFFDRYLKHGSTHAIVAAGSVRGVAQLSASA